MIRRTLWTFAFALFGLASVFTWASVDEHLCRMFPALCMPRAGECGGGLDACASDMRTVFDVIAYMLLPVLVFAAIGFFMSGRKRRISTCLACLALAIALHWMLTLLGVRVLHV